MTSSSAPETRVHADAETLAESVAESLITRLVEIQAEGRVPSVALTGGTIARLVHRRLASSMNGLDVDWDEIDFWFGDERYVAADSDDRNAGQAQSDLLEQVEADPARIHAMPSSDSGLSLDEAADAYADTVRKHGTGAFDVVFLGVGPDAHVASLFPGHPALDAVERIAVGVADSPKPPPERITLTFEALNRSHAVWFVASGEEKSTAVSAALAAEGEVRTTPARGVSGSEETVWWLDRAAASRL